MLGLLAAGWLLSDPDDPGDWPAYGADKANTKYSALDQIDATNFGDLEIAWRWTSADQEILKARPELRTGFYEATPLIVGGTLYTSTSLSQVAAIDPATGSTGGSTSSSPWAVRTCRPSSSRCGCPRTGRIPGTS